MAVSISISVIITSLHLVAFVLAIGAESRRSTVTISLFLSIFEFSFFFCSVKFILRVLCEKAKVVPDQYDESTYCVYDTDASTVYGLAAFGLLLISQMIVNGVTRCLCFGKGLVTGSCSATCAIIFFIVSW
jgi:hypothetical protein